MGSGPHSYEMFHRPGLNSKITQVAMLDSLPGSPVRLIHLLGLLPEKWLQNE
jgi:hypothetical protein